MRNPTIKSILLSALVSLAPAAMGCSPVRSHSASLATAPFSQYRTFSFGDPQSAPAGFKTSSRTAEVERKMQPLIATLLRERGYEAAEAGKTGDLVIGFASGSRRGLKRPAGPSHGVPDAVADDEEEDFVEGAIVIDMFDGTNAGQVWHGAARTEVNPSKIDDELLQRAVRQVLAPFPRRAAPVTDPSAGPPP